MNMAAEVKIFRASLAESSGIRRFATGAHLTRRGDGDKIIALRFEAICPEVRRIIELYGGKINVQYSRHADDTAQEKAGG